MFLTIETYKMILNLRVDNEYWLEMMNVASLESFRENIHFRTDSSVRNLRKFCLHVISKASEVLHIHTSSCLHVLLNVLGEGFPNDEELGLGLQRLHAWLCTCSRCVVLTRVLIPVLQDPIRKRISKLFVQLRILFVAQVVTKSQQVKKEKDE